MTRPKIVCLCGSTRFFEAFQRANYEETMKGHIVLTVGHYPNSKEHGQNTGCTPEQKKALDELHLRKIDMADEVLVLNCKRGQCVGCGEWFDYFGYDARMLPEGHAPGCTEIVVPAPYIDESTSNVIAYAMAHRKPVRYLERHG